MATIFPSNPVVDDIFEKWKWNGTGWKLIGTFDTGEALVDLNRYALKSVPVVAAKTSTHVLELGDEGKLIEANGTLNINIPTDEIDFAIGTQVSILNVGTGVVTIGEDVPLVTVLNGTPGLKLRTRWSSATLIKRAENTWVAIGDLTA
jgi:hypothetical protein